MCLATPGRIVEISTGDPAFPVARVDFGGVVRTAQLVYVPDARVGEYVIVQAGFAIRKLPPQEAEESLRCAREFDELARSQERAARVPSE
ncbi:MAG: HypC/HybG/HupF family hydrogenase formation chaperone [Thermoplasmata archaeon]